MRPYPLNSPEAAMRIVLLVALADGNACPAEFEALEKLEAAWELDVMPDLVPPILQSLHEDLETGAQAGNRGPLHVDDATLAAVLGEINDLALQQKVIGLAQAAAHADHYLDACEARILDAARNQWWLWPSSAPEPCDVLAWRYA